MSFVASLMGKTHWNHLMSTSWGLFNYTGIHAAIENGGRAKLKTCMTPDPPFHF